jgi:DNA-binding response OmpR family regulator
MKIHCSEMTDAPESALICSDLSASEAASMDFLVTSSRPDRNHDAIQGAPNPSNSRSVVAQMRIDIEGLPIRFRVFLERRAARTQSDVVAGHANRYSPLACVLTEIIDGIRESILRRKESSDQTPTAEEVISSGEAATEVSAPPMQIVLRVGPLELHLLDRVVKRGNRQIDLRPREFRLLRYMMERSDQLLTRTTLLKEIWNYKFASKTNLVDVHMGRLRRKVDGPNEPRMLRSVHGAGFILNAVSESRSEVEESVSAHRIMEAGNSLSGG